MAGLTIRTPLALLMNEVLTPVRFLESALPDLSSVFLNIGVISWQEMLAEVLR